MNVPHYYVVRKLPVVIIILIIYTSVIRCLEVAKSWHEAQQTLDKKKQVFIGLSYTV